jgi:hypothetical protein
MMKKMFTIMLAGTILASQIAAAAEKPTYLEEAAALGSIAGQGLACRAKKYHKFELLARAIVVSKAKSDKMQQDGLQTFNEAKVNSFMDIESEKFSECDEIVYAFNRQKIFETVLYRNGKVKMPDGSLIVPRKEYDVSKLYKRDPEAFAKADAAYKKAVAQAMENGKKQQKVKLKDANYADFANQFE